MKIVVDENMPLTQALFAEFGEVVALPGRTMTAEQLADADILLVRSVTKVNATLLSQANKLKFVGTATIGTDHIDKAFLAEKNITFASAPGCNKVSVGEYIISALLVIAEKYQFSLSGLSLGIVGAGNTGSAVAGKARQLGINVKLCDPFKAQSGDSRTFVSYEEALKCDLISFHVPLTRNCEHATFHLLDKKHIQALRSDQILLNASRGEVWDNQAMLSRQQSAEPLRLVMDVWENEPDILHELVPFTEIATPHIAGYSLEGKYRGTFMLYEAFCQQFGFEMKKQLSPLLPVADICSLSLQTAVNEAVLKKLIHLVYDVRRDDARFRHLVGQPGQFDEMRKKYPERREWSSLSVVAESDRNVLVDLGFNVSGF
jgi:Phosphoglycerate dehydrogenase and related dehydrogenases